MNYNTSAVSACSVHTIVYNFNITSESSKNAQLYDYVDTYSLSGDLKLWYIIYRTTNKINRKIYVGQKYINCRNFKSYLGSGTIFKKAVKKYRKENYYRETIEYCTSATVDERETYWIAELSATNPLIGYNFAIDGRSSMKGKQHTEETKRKMSKSSTGKQLAEETKTKLREAHLGKHNTEEQNIKIGNASKGNQYALGYTHTVETKRKISEANKGKSAWNKGKTAWNKGICSSEETKRKIGDAKKGNTFWLGRHHTEDSRKKMQDSMKKYWEEKKSAEIIKVSNV